MSCISSIQMRRDCMWKPRRTPRPTALVGKAEMLSIATVSPRIPGVSNSPLARIASNAARVTGR